MLVVSLTIAASPLPGQVAKTEKYSPEVVEKAEKILESADLRRTGKQIQATGTTDITRAMSGLAREKRELRLLHRDWKVISQQMAAVGKEQQRLKNQHQELSLQLARVAGDTTANNRVVGLLNATTAQIEKLSTERDRLKREVANKRAVLNEAESAYAEKILAIRQVFTAVQEEVRKSLNDKNVQIALQVMNANFETPKDITADQVLAALNKRIEKIEQEVFSESIPLDVENRSMYVNVAVGRKTTRMVVDSGASLICLPARTADDLGVIVPPDARDMRLILADGRAIPAKAVTLPRVRVGEFEVENVEAAVLDATATDAEPLLGMSFLDNFKFEINAADRSLKMLRVESE